MSLKRKFTAFKAVIVIIVLCVVSLIPTGMKLAIAFPYPNVFFEEVFGSNPFSMEMDYPLTKKNIKKLKMSEKKYKKELVFEDGSRLPIPDGATSLSEIENQENIKIKGDAYIVTKDSFKNYSNVLEQKCFVLDRMSDSYEYTKGNIKVYIWVSDFLNYYKKFSIKGYSVNGIEKKFTVEVIDKE